jgi:hypothetical protein
MLPSYACGRKRDERFYDSAPGMDARKMKSKQQTRVITSIVDQTFRASSSFFWKSLLSGDSRRTLMNAENIKRPIVIQDVHPEQRSLLYPSYAGDKVGVCMSSNCSWKLRLLVCLINIFLFASNLYCPRNSRSISENGIYALASHESSTTMYHRVRWIKFFISFPHNFAFRGNHKIWIFFAFSPMKFPSLVYSLLSKVLLAASSHWNFVSKSFIWWLHNYAKNFTK